MNKLNTQIWDKLAKSQPLATSAIRQALASDKLSHAYLFIGNAEEDKYNMAYIIAKTLLCVDTNACEKCVNCELLTRSWLTNKDNKPQLPSLSGLHPDLKVYAPFKSKSIKIDDIKDLISESNQPPFQSPYHVFIVDDADTMTTEAANAFLKSLEEPPASTIYLLFADTLENLLSTIISRCQIIPLKIHGTPARDKEIPPFLIPLTDHMPLGKIFALIACWMDIVKDSEKKEYLTSYLRQLQQKYWDKNKEAVLNGETDIDINSLEFIEDAILMLNHHVDPKLVIENCFLKILS